MLRVIYLVSSRNNIFVWNADGINNFISSCKNELWGYKVIMRYVHYSFATSEFVSVFWCRMNSYIFIYILIYTLRVYSLHNSFIDWLKLRRNHRVLGELVGSLPKPTRQDVFSGLPLLLLPEEVTLLLEKNIARLVRYASLEKLPNESLSKRFKEYRETLFLEQAECLKESRKRQVKLLHMCIHLLSETFRYQNSNNTIVFG